MGRVGVRTAYFWVVAHGLPIDMSLPRAERLNQLLAPLDALLAGEPSGMANLACWLVHARFAATIWASANCVHSWVGHVRNLGGCGHTQIGHMIML